jgi:CBS domain-containing protein
MLVKDIMTKEPITVKYNDFLVKAYKLMKEKRLRHLPVVDRNDKLTGILSHRDILDATRSHFEERGSKENSNVLHIALVESMMSRKLQTISPTTELKMAADIMRAKKISCLPVLEDEKIVGILTESDFLCLA